MWPASEKCCGNRFYSWNIVFERGYFCDGRLTDLDYLLAALRERRALEYRPLSYAEAWQAGRHPLPQKHAPDPGSGQLPA